ncbi:MAG: RNA-binding protein, partial [Sediminibacterium sp.]|nr:RNA-binding protein [Sediminibacterium sp.]
NDPGKRKNLLYINQGADKDHVPHFREMAAEYGLDDSSHATQAAFFDYDNDGDLDVYVVTNEINKDAFPDNFHPVLKDGSNPSTGKLFRNDWNAQVHHPVFTNVSKEAGIQTEGYGHSVAIMDVNKDGWKDIYVANDFITNDLLWINNHNGTFSEQLSVYFKHTSANAMGSDFTDINNDGLVDAVSLDMNPADNYRKKMMMGSNSYQKYQNSDLYGYNYQYVRNTLQLNQGPRLGQQDSMGMPIFSEIAFFAGIAETDWSWTPLVTDFDNDGNRDIIVTNGFPKDVTDHDFTTFRNQAYQVASKQHILSQIPEVKLHNYAFKNNGDLSFSDVSAKWGMTTPSFSNGAAYADLDNDGDLDVIINNINDEASVYQNTARESNPSGSHYLQVRCVGDSQNINGIGAWIELHYDHGKKQVLENTPYRGYLSTLQGVAHFGLGSISSLDSVLVRWPAGKMQVLKNVKADQVVTFKSGDAHSSYSFDPPVFATHTLFTEVTGSLGIHFIHTERDFIDFNIQKLLPHKLSEYGPALAVGDIDGNGLDDILSGGPAFASAQLFLQQANGQFVQRGLLPAEMDLHTKTWEDMGLLLFDADGDGDLDLYVSSGGYEAAPGTAPYQDKLYVNDGKGKFSANVSVLPANLTSKFCVRAIDYDKDGDLDLFVSGRVEPWNYPKPVSSFIFRNDGKNGHIVFTDVTNTIAKDLKNIGLVCDAVFTDFDNDGWPDLVLAGEWMPVTFLKNEKGIFKNVTAATGTGNQLGLWNTIAPGDFDNDGDIDYIIGNQGQNSFYKATEKYPILLYAKDFDNNGSYDAFPFLYLPVSQTDTTRKLFPAQTRDDIVKQMIGMRVKFQNYKSFASAGPDEMFSKEQLKDALLVKATNLRSSYLRNDGNGKFVMMPLPVQAQFSVLNGMVADDFDGDGNLDVLMNGNDYGTEVTVGRYDALNGLLLRGDGKGNFTALSILESGIYLPGNGKALVKLKDARGNYLLAASQNRGALKIFEGKRKTSLLTVGPGDAYAVFTYKNGLSRRNEFYYGSSFLSQSARFVNLDSNLVSAIVYDSKGVGRKVK